MIQDILKRKQEIIDKLIPEYIHLENIQALLLTGSHYWGYASEESDIDLILVENEWRETKSINVDNVSIEIITHTKALENHVSESNWGKYYLLKYCTYPLMGELPELIFDARKISEFFIEKREIEVKSIINNTIKKGFHSVMQRVFFINYQFQGLKTFKLTDFIFCNELADEQKSFMEDMMIKLFDRVDGSDEDKFKLKALCVELEEKIKVLNQ